MPAMPQKVFPICDDFRQLFRTQALGQLVDYLLQVLLCMGVIDDFIVGFDPEFLRQQRKAFPITAGAIPTKNHVAGTWSIQFFQIRFEKIKGAIDSGQCGIVYRSNILTRVAVYIEQLNNDLDWLPPVGMIALPFEVFRSSSPFGSAFSKTAPIHAHKQDATRGAVGIGQRDIVSALHGFHPQLHAEPLDGFHIELNTI